MERNRAVQERTLVGIKIIIRIMKRYYVVLFAASIFFSACAKQIETQELQEEEIGRTITELVAEVPEFSISEASKTIVGPTGTFQWSPDDKLGFWPDKGNVKIGNPKQVIFYVDPNSKPSKRATFIANGWGLLVGNKYYSYYPYSSSATSASVPISYTGQKQTENDNTAHLGGYDYLHSSLIIPSGSIYIDYKHFGCVAQFILTLSELYSANVFTSLSITAPSAIIVESATYNPSTDTPALAIAKSSNTLTIALNNISCAADNTLTVYAMMSPVNWVGQTINVVLSDNAGHIYNGTFTPTKAQAAGNAYTYRATLKYGSESKPSSTEDNEGFGNPLNPVSW